VTRNEARKLIKTRVQTRYSNSVMLLLLKIVDLTYRKDKDNAECQIETTADSLMRAAAVKTRQFANIINQLSDDAVLLNVSNGKRVSCRLNLEPLTQLETYGDKQKAEKKVQGTDRAAKARAARAARRDPDFSTMNAYEIVQHGAKLFEQAVASL
jgi:hypothetical protein